MGRIVLGAPRKKPTRNAQAIRVGDIIFTTGVPFDWDTSEIVGGTIQEQTKLTMENIKTTLEACGSSMDNIDKCTVFITDRAHFSGMNEVFYSYFPDTTPVRSLAIVQLLYPKLMIEIEVIAHIEKK